MKLTSPSVARNTEPIGDVLAEWLPPSGLVLELASGTGEHMCAFARRFPGLRWQPSDLEDSQLASIEAWRTDIDLPNIDAPVRLDVREPWPVRSADVVLCINMVHITPWDCTEALFRHANACLADNGRLILYGPYRIDGVTAPSNVAFEQWLHARDQRFGVRDVRDLDRLAMANDFALPVIVPMPANNHMLLYRREPRVKPETDD